MSWSERFVQDHRQRTDSALHRACSQLVSDPSAFTHFQKMLNVTRQRAPRLFEAPVVDGRHLGVDALVNLTAYRGLHLRPVTEWAGTSSSWRPVVASLAHHLVCEYKVPTFLAAAWYANDSDAQKKRRWFVAHSHGASFRSLDLPIAMTRRMEHIFLSSHDHLPIEHAIRRSELLALGASADCLKAVLSTRVATDLRDSEFWRTVWMFLIANESDVDPTQIGPMIDYIQAVRFDQARNRMTPFGSPEPAFSIKGRTVQSLMRLMREWHNSLRGTGAILSWTRSSFEPMSIEEPVLDRSEPPRHWQMMELTNSGQLRGEGAAMSHCVASYAGRCYYGSSSIWSLRQRQHERTRSVLTVEIDPKKRTIVQARGYANRVASGKPLQLLQQWATRERLQMAI